ncbi:MAG: phosphate signaling complex protein PhoU [Chthoniobacterales bacterium]|nr:phosphate signaling complex protein PhoU [Chthoniobacterales bacterium]
MQNPPQQQPQHIFSPFEQALSDIRSQVIMMGSLVQRSLQNAQRGLFERDISACGMAIADDEEIDALEIQNDRFGVEILTRFQPLASDMRQVIAAMKVSNNLERIGDQVVTIARRALRLNNAPPLAEVAWLEPMFRMASEMFSDSIRYYADSSDQPARLMNQRDLLLDEKNRELTDRLADRMAQDVANLRSYLDLIFISRVLERIGDHSKNICEDVVYICAAEDIRHQKILKKI